jgi:SAM-dependent methyltransferase
MDLGFRGEVADLYHRYRRGYPPQVVAELVAAFGLTENDLVVDLGCGTGQLAIPLARHVRTVVGLDPEGDMLARARAAAAGESVQNVCWVLGSDADVPSLRTLLGQGSVGAVCIGQALHWMDHETLFPALRSLVRAGGGVAVVTNGLPLWLQDSPWSRALRSLLQEWLGAPLAHSCGTDEESQHRYRSSLAATGFEVVETRVDYSDELSLDQVIGGVYSALSVDRLPPPEDRPEFADRVAAALEEHAPFLEHVPVAMLIGRKRNQ